MNAYKITYTYTMILMPSRQGELTRWHKDLEEARLWASRNVALQHGEFTQITDMEVVAEREPGTVPGMTYQEWVSMLPENQEAS